MTDIYSKCDLLSSVNSVIVEECGNGKHAPGDADHAHSDGERTNKDSEHAHGDDEYAHDNGNYAHGDGENAHGNGNYAHVDGDSAHGNGDHGGEYREYKDGYCDNECDEEEDSQNCLLCENIYNFVKLPDGKVSKQLFLKELENRGILQDDPRISEMMKSLEEFTHFIEKDAFKMIIACSKLVIEQAFTDAFNIPKFEKFTGNLREIYFEARRNNSGENAQYIPQLQIVDPDQFGLSVCSIDGQRINIGEAMSKFSIQSCSKPISYCMALEEVGTETVHKHVGREPSGVRFNAIKVNQDKVPHNPLINPGAIMVCSLIQRHLQPADRFDYVTEVWSELAGGMPFGFSNSIYLSERNTGDRNFAIGHFMMENGAFPPNTNILDVMEFYFQICSLLSNTNYMSIVAATLANGGVCPLTKKQVFSADTVKSCLSMMYSCGMYDYSGEFAYSIGLPAKSGVGGAIFMVIPNVMGICTFSPRLDEYGNSARGVEFYARMIKKFNFHMFDNIEITSGEKEDPRQKNNAEEITVEKIIKYSSVGDMSALQVMRPSVADLCKGDYDQRTPLHLAASNGHIAVVKYLVEKIGKKRVNPVDRWNGTPYDDAKREFNDKVADYLKSVGGREGKELVKGGGRRNSEVIRDKRRNSEIPKGIGKDLRKDVGPRRNSEIPSGVKKI